MMPACRVRSSKLVPGSARRDATAVIERLHREITAVQNSREVQRQFYADGATIVRMNPARVR